MNHTSTRLDRRWFLKRLPGLGVATVAVATQQSRTDAARRGYGGPNLTAGGLVVAVVEGAEPGTFRYDVIRSDLGPGPYLTVVNRTNDTLESEVVMPDGSSVHRALDSYYSLLLRIGVPGTVRFRAWPIGSEPGEYIDLVFPNG